MNMTHSMGDALLSVSLPLVSGTTYSPAIKLAEGELTRDGRHLQRDELIVSVPELTATELPADASFTYSIQFSDEQDFAMATEIREISDSLAKVNGSASGAPDFLISFRIPYQRDRFARLKAVSAGTPGATTKVAKFDYIM